MVNLHSCILFVDYYSIMNILRHVNGMGTAICTITAQTDGYVYHGWLLKSEVPVTEKLTLVLGSCQMPQASVKLLG